MNFANLVWIAAMSHDCIFCLIGEKKAQAHLLYEDDVCVAFLDTRPIREGHALVIPKAHIDHFLDIPDDVSHRIFSVGKKLGVKMRKLFNPLRVGYVVAGFGVPHAHLHVYPLWEAHDLTSSAYLDTTQQPPVFDLMYASKASNSELQDIAVRLRSED
jgi:histidine triad (HIT) family protein